MKRITLIISAAVAIFLAGCVSTSQSNPNPEIACQSLKQGMTKSEVVQIMGTPDHMRNSFNLEGKKISEFWTYNGNSNISVHFDLNGNLTNWKTGAKNFSKGSK